MKRVFTLFFLFCGLVSVYGQAKFSTSLHSTREGKNSAYKKANGGMELITNIPMSSMACQKCHSTTEKYPNGSAIDAATYAPSCNDCHNMAQGFTVPEQTCLNCHSRQGYERTAYPNVDVHTQRGMTCTSCHKKAELHGDDGVVYASLKQAGAIKTKCEDCHKNLAGNTSHATHVGKVECAGCHAKAVLTCAGCHLETVIATGKNRAINQIKDYRLLVKKDGKIRLGGVMSHSWNGKTNYIVSSYHSHTIAKNATTCTDCHANMGGNIPAITEYNSTGKMTVNKWNAETKKISGPTGVVPLTSDWRSAIKFDFVTYKGDVNNLTSDPTKWEYLKSEADNAHLFYAEPLDNSTLAKLGFTRMPSTLYFAQMADGGGYITHMILANPGSTDVTITLDLFKSDGTPLSITINGTAGSSFPYTIKARGSLSLKTPGTGAQVATGWVRIQANGPMGGSLIYSYLAGGKVVSEAGLDPSVPVQEFCFTVDTRQAYFSGLAVVNPNTSALNVRYALYDANGVLKAQSNQTLGALQHSARVLGEIFPGQNLTDFTGTVAAVSSTGMMVATTLRFDGAVDSLSSIPVITGIPIAALPAAAHAVTQP